MKIIFNDATEINVQQVEPHGEYLRVLTVGNTPEQLKVLFTDASRTARMIVQERGQTVATYEGYTEFYRTEIYTGRIYGVMMYKAETLPEVQVEVQAAAVLVAQIQAQSLTDEQALTVKALYKDWEKDPDGYQYEMSNPDDKRRNYGGRLWNLNMDHKKQSDWYPGKDPTLWTEIVEGHAGTKEGPIPVPVPDSVTTSGFEYEYGKYYQEGDTVYLMDRTGMNTGESVKLYFAPSALLGQYFSAVE